MTRSAGLSRSSGNSCGSAPTNSLAPANSTAHRRVAAPTRAASSPPRTTEESTGARGTDDVRSVARASSTSASATALTSPQPAARERAISIVALASPTSQRSTARETFSNAARQSVGRFIGRLWYSVGRVRHAGSVTVGVLLVASRTIAQDPHRIETIERLVNEADFGAAEGRAHAALESGTLREHEVARI